MVAASLACAVGAWAGAGRLADARFADGALAAMINHLQAVADDVARSGPAAAGVGPRTATPPATASDVPAPLATIPLGTRGDAIAVGDVSGDGRDDVVVTTLTENEGAPDRDYRVTIFLQQSDGTLASPIRVVHSTGSTVTGLALLQADGDGILDIAVSHRLGLTLIPGSPTGAFARRAIAVVPPGPMAVVDENGDGHADLALAPGLRFRGDGLGGFTQLGSANQTLPREVLARDVDVDGRSDLVTHFNWEFRLWSNSAIGGFTDAGTVLTPLGYSALGPAVGDFTGDGKPDLITLGTITNHTAPPATMLQLYGNEQGRFQFQAGWTQQTGPDPLSSLAADRYGDGREDLLVRHATAVRYHHHAVGGGLEPPVVFALPARPPSNATSAYVPNPRTLAVGDVNGDGCRDMVVVDDMQLVALTGPACTALPPPEPPRVSVDDAFGVEGDPGQQSPRVFTIRMSRPSTVPVSFSAFAESWTATEGSDFAPFSTIVTLPAGQTTAAVTVMVIGDDEYEEAESFKLRLADPQGVIIHDDWAEATMWNDDAIPERTLSIEDAIVTEGAAGTSTNLTFTVRLSASSPVEVFFNYSTADSSAVAEDDYVARSWWPVRIPPGATSVTFDIPINGDGAAEDDEAFFVTLHGAGNATVSDGKALGRILDDDGGPRPPPPGPEVPTLSIEDEAADEGALGQRSTMTFPVRLSRPATTDTTFDFAFADGTALRGSDYLADSGRGVIPAGAMVGTIAVTLLGDDTYEGNERFTARLTSAQGAAILFGQATGTIRGDESPPTLTIDDANVDEGGIGTDTPLAFTLRLSRAIGRPLSVDIATLDGTARSGNDFRGRDERIHVPAGATQATFVVPVLGDRGLEGDETFTVQLSTAEDVILFKSEATGTIRDDDAPHASRPLPREPVPGKGGPSSDVAPVEPITDACALRKWNQAELRRCASSVSALWTTSYRSLHSFLWGRK